MKLLTNLISLAAGAFLAQGIISGDLSLIAIAALLLGYNVLQDNKED
ncbi:hypothetical protein [Leuconostoc citreum]|nr:hypothetical protein [Leuconostoc citreum]